MGEIKVAVYIKNGEGKSTFKTKNTTMPEICTAIAHLELKKQELLNILKRGSNMLQEKKDNGKKPKK